jgi:signal transduction histidine kinase
VAVDESVVNSVEEKMRLVIPILFCVGGILVAFSLIFVDVQNKYLALRLIFAWVLCSLSAIIFKQIRQKTLVVLAVLVSLAFPLLVIENGVVPVATTPLLAAIIVLLLTGWLRVFCVFTMSSAPLLLLVDGDPVTTAIALRAALSAVVLSILISYLRSSYQGLVDKTKLQLEANERIYGVIGHELRTPAATLKMLIDVELEQNRSKNIVELQQLSTHLLCVLDDMKMSSFSGSLSVYNNDEVISVHDIVERAIEGVKPLAEKRHFIINFETQKSASAHHKGSTKAIFQIIQNLTKNAILHSGGSSVTVTKTAVDLSDDTTHYRINVIDDGNGIDPKFRDKMFNAFERGETLSEGTGLGLNVCKQIAYTLGQGDLHYIESPGGGANFELTFVLNKCDESDTSTLIGNDIELLENLNILLVEDTPILRMISSKILAQNGAIVTEAEDGIIGLNKMKENDFDLVITDIMMPNCDGYELTKALRKQGFTRPIIGVTGATMGNEANRLVACGANAVLPKPLTLASITEELKKLKIPKT